MDMLHEAGAAIGNVGRRILRRKRRALIDEVLERWSTRAPLPQVSLTTADQRPAEDEVIDASYRILDEDHPPEKEKGKAK
jgi:hypothetical protein